MISSQFQQRSCPYRRPPHQFHPSEQSFRAARVANYQKMRRRILGLRTCAASVLSNPSSVRRATAAPSSSERRITFPPAPPAPGGIPPIPAPGMPPAFIVPISCWNCSCGICPIAWLTWEHMRQVQKVRHRGNDHVILNFQTLLAQTHSYLLTNDYEKDTRHDRIRMRLRGTIKVISHLRKLLRRHSHCSCHLCSLCRAHALQQLSHLGRVIGLASGAADDTTKKQRKTFQESAACTSPQSSSIMSIEYDSSKNEY